MHRVFDFDCLSWSVRFGITLIVNIIIRTSCKYWAAEKGIFFISLFIIKILVYLFVNIIFFNVFVRIQNNRARYLRPPFSLHFSKKVDSSKLNFVQFFLGSLFPHKYNIRDASMHIFFQKDANQVIVTDLLVPLNCIFYSKGMSGGEHSDTVCSICGT